MLQAQTLELPCPMHPLPAVLLLSSLFPHLHRPCSFFSPSLLYTLTHVQNTLLPCPLILSIPPGLENASHVPLVSPHRPVPSALYKASHGHKDPGRQLSCPFQISQLMLTQLQRLLQGRTLVSGEQAPDAGLHDAHSPALRPTGHLLQHL